jgi:hypothetical protein
MTLRLAATLAALGLLAGCDGGLHLAGRVVRADGQPVAGAKVTITVDERSPRAEQGPDVRETDAQGNFRVDRLDCPCDFAVRIEADHAEYGHARLVTTHKALRPDQVVTLKLDGTANVGGKPE